MGDNEITAIVGWPTEPQMVKYRAIADAAMKFEREACAKRCEALSVTGPPAIQIAARLRRYNEWRRGADIPQPSPSEIGADIDAAASLLEIIGAGGCLVD